MRECLRSCVVGVDSGEKREKNGLARWRSNGSVLAWCRVLTAAPIRQMTPGCGALPGSVVGQRNCCCQPRERLRGKAPRRSVILATTRPTRTTTRRPAATATTTTTTTALAPRRPSRRRAKRRSVAGGWLGGREGATRTPDQGEHQQHRQYQPAREGAGRAAVGAETQHDRREGARRLGAGQPPDRSQRVEGAEGQRSRGGHGLLANSKS
jgi:hypothetical protein